MSNKYFRFAGLALAVLGFIILNRIGSSEAQHAATETYAIVNARIIPAAGSSIEKGTIVIRDGLIAAVGANVSAPADARIIEGTGLTVYPGLIDANTALGMPQPSPAPTAGAGRGGGGGQFQFPGGPAPMASALNSTQPAGLQPEIMAADYLRAGGEQIAAERNAGITTALSAPRAGILTGQSALINLAGNTPQQMIVRSPVALHVGFTPLRGGGYPGSLMGVFSAIRQMLLDAQRYQEAQKIYARSPRGVRRPEPDKSLEALLPVLNRELPVIMYADREREISRAIELAQEFKLRAIIAGGEEAWKIADRLREAQIAVILSLNFPHRTTTASLEADPEPLRILRARVEAPKCAARLAAAHVRFAFESGGMTNIEDFRGNVIKSVENGLAPDDAIKALTISAAEILSAADRLGSIETGKIANLTITRGNLLERATRIAYVFIDGREIDLPANAAPAAAPSASPAATATPESSPTPPETEITIAPLGRAAAGRIY
jgi:imidazolonepropionase-like amidohydrolase